MIRDMIITLSLDSVLYNPIKDPLVMIRKKYKKMLKRNKKMRKLLVELIQDGDVDSKVRQKISDTIEKL